MGTHRGILNDLPSSLEQEQLMKLSSEKSVQEVLVNNEKSWPENWKYRDHQLTQFTSANFTK